MSPVSCCASTMGRLNITQGGNVTSGAVTNLGPPQALPLDSWVTGGTGSDLFRVSERATVLLVHPE